MKPEKILEDITKKTIETSQLYNNPSDNCMLCRHSDIKKNEVAKYIRFISPSFADTIDSMFPVVLCKKMAGKYIPNPLARPGWCPRDR